MNWSTSRASTSLTCSIRAILIAMAIKEVLLYYHARENFGGGKLANLADCELFAKIFLINSFYLYSSPNLSHAEIFPCMVA